MPRRSRRLFLESLESREVPTVFTWQPTAPNDYTADYSWNNAANWLNATSGVTNDGFPDDSTDTAIITSALAGNQTITLEGLNFTIGALTFGSAAPANGTFTILADGAGGGLTLDDVGPATLTKSGTGTDAILAPITIAGGLNLTAAGTLVLGGNITGTGPLVTSGSIAWLGDRTVGSGVTLAGTGAFTSPPVLIANSVFDSGLYAFDGSSGAKLATLVAPSSSFLLFGPSGTTIGPDGNVYISSAGNMTSGGSPTMQGAILKYDLTTYSLTTFISADQLDAARVGTSNPNALYSPSGIAFGPDGDLYSSLSGGQSSFGGGAVIRFDVSAGAYAGTFAQVVGSLFQPSGLTFGVGGDATSLYVSNLGFFTNPTPPPPLLSGGQIEKVSNATTTPSSTAFIAASSQLNFASGTVWGPDGNFYVADLGATSFQGQVLQYRPSGAFLSSYAAPSSSLLFQFPSGLLFDSAGRLLVANIGPAGGGSMPSVSLAGSINRYDDTGANGTTFISSSVFPNTGPNPSPPPTNKSGFAPSDLELTAAGSIAVPAGGSINPGTAGSPGTLTAGDVTFAAGSTFTVDLSTGTSDRLTATGPLNLGGATLNLASVTGSVTVGTVITIASGSSVTGTFASLANNATISVGGQAFRINYTGTAVTLTAVTPASPLFTSATAATFYSGGPYSFTVTGTGTPPPTFAVTAGALPAGITLAPNGTLSGVATQVGVFPFTITATNGIGPAATQSFTLTVLQGIPATITSPSSTRFTLGLGGTFPITAAGFPTPTLAVGPLPAGFSFNPATGVLTAAPSVPFGTYTIDVTATNGIGTPGTQTLTVTVATAQVGRTAVSGSPVGTAAVFNPGAAGSLNPAQVATVDPFGVRGINVRTAVADVNGDGVDDVILVTGPGTPVKFAVVSGTDFRTVLVAPTSPFAGSENFTGGGFVAAGDFDGDGKAEVVVTPDQGGGPRVSIYSVTGSRVTLRANFLGIDDAAFRGGARPAVGDVNGDGVLDLIVAAGFGGGPRVAIYDGADVLTGQLDRLVPDFFVFEPTLANGVYVAAGDVNGDGFADLIFGGGPGGGPRVLVLDGKTAVDAGVAVALGTPLADFFVNNSDATRGGIRVAAKYLFGDGRASVLVGSGEGEPSRVRVYPPTSLTPFAEPTPFEDLDPFGGVLAGGVFVG